MGEERLGRVGGRARGGWGEWLSRRGAVGMTRRAGEGWFGRTGGWRGVVGQAGGRVRGGGRQRLREHGVSLRQLWLQNGDR